MLLREGGLLGNAWFSLSTCEFPLAVGMPWCRKTPMVWPPFCLGGGLLLPGPPELGVCGGAPMPQGPSGEVFFLDRFFSLNVWACPFFGGNPSRLLLQREANTVSVEFPVCSLSYLVRQVNFCKGRLAPHGERCACCLPRVGKRANNGPGSR